jgi:hypothetical protein
MLLCTDWLVHAFVCKPHEATVCAEGALRPVQLVDGSQETADAAHGVALQAIAIS